MLAKKAFSSKSKYAKLVVVVSSPDNAKLGHFTLMFSRGRQRNVPRIITHVLLFCVVQSLPLPSSFALGPYLRHHALYEVAEVLTVLFSVFCPESGSKCLELS